MSAVCLSNLTFKRSLFSLTIRSYSLIFSKMENCQPSNKMKTLQIGTHDGTFHCDEVLACYLIKLLPEYKTARILRSRNNELLNSCDIVVDVGAVYDKKKLRFDHHQKEFQETLSTLKNNLNKKFNIRLSSAGLVYAHYGEQIIKQLTNLSDTGVSAVYEKVYEYFIQEIDAIDNGISLCDGQENYKISTHLSSRVANLNPTWNNPDDNINELFEKAVALAGNEFLDKVKYFSKSWWPAKEIVKNAIERRYSIHPSGRIVELEVYVPWKQHFFDLKTEINIDGEVSFFIYQEKNEWRIIAVPLEPNSFIGRTFLKEEWRGLRGEELSNISGISGCIFCHNTGFIGGNNTKEGVIDMAVKSF